MTRDHRPMPYGSVYAPLLGRMVECATLHVARFGGRRFKPARDEGGRVIELPVAAELGELERRVAAPGRYRVSARDPTSGNLMAHSDYVLGPEPEASAPSLAGQMFMPAEVVSCVGPVRTHERIGRMAESPAVKPMHRPARMVERPGAREPLPFPRAPEPRVAVPAYGAPVAPEPGHVAMLYETIGHLRGQLRAHRTRADDERREEVARAMRAISEERERGEAALRASEEARETWRARAFEAEVRLAGASAWLDEREAQVARLERRVGELEAEVASARREAAGLRQSVGERALSPLDALGQMDEAIDVIGKAAQRFGERA
ncbi:MAG: hypothetical protein R3F65_32345 [bacterium]